MIRFGMLRMLVLVASIAFAGPASAQPAARAARAEAFYRKAVRDLERNSIDARRQALRDLEQATLLAPGQPLYELTLARAYYRAGFLKRARERFERVTRLAPEDPDARLGLGQIWRRDWLKYLDATSLDRAIEHTSAAARLRPERVDGWLALVPLLVERGDLRAASSAAHHAAEGDPRPEATLAVAYTEWRLGRVTEAESAFVAAIPRLPRNVRERFDDISPVATQEDTTILHHLPTAQQAEFVRRFWKETDPDLATAANEAQLEYWSRVTQAYFLFYDVRRREWDERGEVYVRYGPPSRADYNPVGRRLSVSFGNVGNFPANLLVWDYPELGMSVTMQDRLLSEYYLLPISLTRDLDPVPDQDSLAKRNDAVATRGGRGVFRSLPPGTESMPVQSRVARFETERGPRLLVQLETAAAPGDTLWAEYVVLDSTQREVARAARSLAPSACDAERRQVAEFATEIAPGPYRVGLSVRGGGNKRGVSRSTTTLAAPREGLHLSDVVISCGPPEVTGGAGGGAPVIRLEPNAASRVEGNDPLMAYFEIYDLRPGPEGRARFEYVTTVRSLEKDPRIWLQRAFAPRPETPPLSTRREEENAGSLRRQFVSIPTQSLPNGRYRLEIRVRDLVAGEETSATADFVKAAAPLGG